MGYRVGVDSGGTFTDFCLFGEDGGVVHTLKVLSTPERPGEEVLNGLKEIERLHGIKGADISYFTHGTTVGVNTVIQRKGINLCLFTTENFRDVLEVARLKMPDPYNLFSRRPVPLVTREKVFGVRERILFDGTIDVELDKKSVIEAIDGVRAVGGEGVVIALLHSYRNPDHEHLVANIVRVEAPDLTVITTDEVWPIIREYERTITAVIAGYVQPRVSHYLSSLQTALMNSGVSVEPMITKSNGGVMSAELGKNQCAQTLLSGTAAGVIGACQVAQSVGVQDALSLDIGGTSADVAVLWNGQPKFGAGEMIGEFPIFVPTVSVTSIGEGGGSIAWVDQQGVLRVGPESAGSSPGPACYGLGGAQPTITDAFVVLGFLGQAGLGYNAVSMLPDLAKKSVGTIATCLGVSLHEAAEAIIRVAVSGMYLEISKLISRYGIDPRRLSLVAFGGAGPMMACHVAQEFALQQVIVPLTPGVLSAFGGLIADIKNDFIKTAYFDLEAKEFNKIREGYLELKERALEWLYEEQGFEGPSTLIYSADLRYRGQSYEIDTLLETSWVDDGDIEAMARAFHHEHQRLYEHADKDAPIQVINLRLIVVGVPPKPQFSRQDLESGEPDPISRVDVFIDGCVQEANVYNREAMRAGQRFKGPAIVIQDDCTSCILSGFNAVIDAYGNLNLERVGSR